MDKRLLLTSVIIMNFVGSAMAESPVIVPVGQFPNSENNEYMQPNTIYVDAAIAANMAGVYKGDVWARAIYVDDTTSVNCSSGTFLPANATSCEPCSANSYCGGGEFSVADFSQGIQSCNVSFTDTGSESCEIAYAVGASRSYSRTCYHKTSSVGATSSSACTGTDSCGVATYGECYVTSCVNGHHKNQETNATACPANTYMVRYNANGGSGSMGNSSHIYDEAKALSANTFTNGIKKFLGWATSSDSATAVYADGQSVKDLTDVNNGIVDLYAVWGDCQACAPGTGANCVLSVVDNACVYTTSCKPGYGNIQNNNSYNPSCTLNTYSCEAGQYLPKNATACATCPEDSYCVGATYTYSTTADQGISACATGLVAPQGAKSATECGKILHVGEDILYLTSEQQTTPALAVRIDGTVYYARTTSGEKAMNGTTTKSLRTRINGIEYSIHDNTVQGE